MRTADDAPYRPGRREFIALGVGSFLVAALPFRVRAAQTVRRTVPIMGTIAEFTVVHADRAHAHAAIDDAIAALQAIDVSMSRFRPGSDVGTANRLALHRAVPIGEDTAAVLRCALNWARASDGRFDPAVGRAVELWDVHHRTTLPSARALREVSRPGLWRALELDTSGDSAVRFHAAAAALDLGGIAKGYGVDRAVVALRHAGIEHALVNVGGDLYALGHSPDGDAWRIGVRSPADPDRLAGVTDVSDAAVATSGDYAQFFTVAGQRYHHLLDPVTGAPRRSAIHSVTVTAASCMAADAGATAAFGLQLDDADALVRRADPSARVLHPGPAALA